MTQDISAALRDMLGPLVGVAVTDPTAPADDLPPALAAAMVRAVPKRRAEFAAGRRAVRAAMADIGLPPADIAQGADRAPIWPAGLSGSIAHCDRACIAAVSAAHPSIGIDIEPATPLDADLIPVICTPAEQAWLARQADAGLAAKMIFSAKEAVYKAQYPLTGQVIGFDAVTLTLSEGGAYRATLALDVPPLGGCIRVVQDVILTICIHQDHDRTV